MKHEDCHIGQYVYYLPQHTKGDFKHKDVEAGTITGKNAMYVFVRFSVHGYSMACKAEMLAVRD